MSDAAPIQSTPQAGAIPYRLTRRGAFEVLLITTSNGRWLIPKGGVDEGDTPEEAAVIEVYEEAGAVGVIEGDAIGSFSYIKRNTPHTVAVFPLRVQRVLSRWQEQGFRERRWLGVEGAATLVALPEIARMIRDLPGHVRDLRANAA